VIKRIRLENDMEKSRLISQRAARMAESPTLRLLAKATKLQSQGEKVFQFHIGEPNIPIPPNVAEAMKKAIESGKTYYTHQAGLPELRQAIADYYQAQFGLTYRRDNIVVTAGPKDTIFKLLGTIVDPGDKIIVPDPHWEAYGELVEFFDGGCLFVPRNREDLSFHLGELEQAFEEKPKAIVFCDPDNPTGYKATPEEISAIAALARKHQCLVLADEIYYLHCYDTEFRSIAHEYPEGTIILTGVSKPWAATGLRLGYALFPEEFKDVAESIAKVTGQASSSVNTPTQYGIIEALSNPKTREWEAEMIALFRERRDVVQRIIGSMLGYPLGGAFYAAPQTPLHSQEFADRLLAEEHVCVLPLSELSSGNHGWFDQRVRVAYGSDVGTLEEGLARFRDFAERVRA
jgi:aspartate aminotransferase